MNFLLPSPTESPIARDVMDMRNKADLPICRMVFTVNLTTTDEITINLPSFLSYNGPLAIFIGPSFITFSGGVPPLPGAAIIEFRQGVIRVDGDTRILRPSGYWDTETFIGFSDKRQVMSLSIPLTDLGVNTFNTSLSFEIVLRAA